MNTSTNNSTRETRKPSRLSAIFNETVFHALLVVAVASVLVDRVVALNGSIV